MLISGWGTGGAGRQAGSMQPVTGFLCLIPAALTAPSFEDTVPLPMEPLLGIVFAALLARVVLPAAQTQGERRVEQKPHQQVR